MDPLSLLSSVRPQAVGGIPGGPEASALKLIPERELAALNSGTLQGAGLRPMESAQALSSVPSLAFGGSAENSFANALGQMVAEVNQKQMVSREMVNGLLSGQPVPLHQAMIAMEEASVSFQLMVEVRNKLLESYQELMRMQV